MRESRYQPKVIDALKAEGALVMKIEPGTGTVPKGFPDLIAILPEGRVRFVETKAPEGRVSPLQRMWLDRLLELGHDAVVARAPKEAT